MERGTQLPSKFEADRDCRQTDGMKGHDALIVEVEDTDPVPRDEWSCRRRGGIEGLRRYYEACLTGSGHRVRTTLERDRRKTLESERERFMSIYLGAAR